MPRAHLGDVERRRRPVGDLVRASPGERPGRLDHVGALVGVPRVGRAAGCRCRAVRARAATSRRAHRSVRRRQRARRSGRPARRRSHGAPGSLRRGRLRARPVRHRRPRRRAGAALGRTSRDPRSRGRWSVRRCRSRSGCGHRAPGRSGCSECTAGSGRPRRRRAWHEVGIGDLCPGHLDGIAQRIVVVAAERPLGLADLDHRPCRITGTSGCEPRGPRRAPNGTRRC